MDKMTLPSPGIGAALWLGLFAALFWVLSRACFEWHKQLKTKGFIPDHLPTVQRFLRIGAALFGLFSGLAALPPLFDPLVALAAVAFLLVVVGSSRHMVRDFTAGWRLHSAGHLRLGSTLAPDGVVGKVTALGPLTTTLIDGSGRRRVIPNHQLVTQTLVIDNVRWPMTVVEVVMDEDGPVSRLQAILTEAVATSPYAAPAPIHLAHSGGHWTIHARLLDLRFEAEFAQSLRERVETLLRRPPC
jgi:hypothetical protein